MWQNSFSARDKINSQIWLDKDTFQMYAGNNTCKPNMRQ